MASTELRKKPLSIFSFDLHAEVILSREAADYFFIAGPSPAMKKCVFSASSARSVRDGLFLFSRISDLVCG